MRNLWTVPFSGQAQVPSREISCCWLPPAPASTNFEITSTGAKSSKNWCSGCPGRKLSDPARNPHLLRNFPVTVSSSVVVRHSPGAIYALHFRHDIGRCATSQATDRSEEHTSELQSRSDLVCRLLLEKKKSASSSPS